MLDDLRQGGSCVNANNNPKVIPMPRHFVQSCRAVVLSVMLGALFFMPLASHAQTTGAARQLHALLDAQWAWETQE